MILPLNSNLLAYRKTLDHLDFFPSKMYGREKSQSDFLSLYYYCSLLDIFLYNNIWMKYNIFCTRCRKTYWDFDFKRWLTLYCFTLEKRLIINFSLYWWLNIVIFKWGFLNILKFELWFFPYTHFSTIYTSGDTTKYWLIRR